MSTRAEVAASRALRFLVDRFASRYARRASGRGIHRRLDRCLRALARLYARFELPRSVEILEALRVNDPRQWTDAPTLECRGCWHGYTLRLDLADYFQRWAYFLSRYHEVPLQLLLRKALQPGDVFVDGGANIGLVSLVAASRVGRSGRVLAFEPNQQRASASAGMCSAIESSRSTPCRSG